MRASKRDAVLAHHLDLDAAAGAAALQFLLQQAAVLFDAVGRPVGEGRQAADSSASAKPVIWQKAALT
jgi:hypothetical protein